MFSMWHFNLTSCYLLEDVVWLLDCYYMSSRNVFFSANYCYQLFKWLVHLGQLNTAEMEKVKHYYTWFVRKCVTPHSKAIWDNCTMHMEWVILLPFEQRTCFIKCEMTAANLRVRDNFTMPRQDVQTTSGGSFFSVEACYSRIDVRWISRSHGDWTHLVKTVEALQGFSIEVVLL